jgi:hypothetical protein
MDIKRTSNISYKEFVEEHLKPDVPVVLRTLRNLV